VVLELAEQGPEPQQAGQAMNGHDGHERDRTDGVRLVLRDGRPADDRADRYGRGEVDGRPLRQGSPFGHPQAQQGGAVHQRHLHRDPEKVGGGAGEPGHDEAQLFCCT